MRAALLGSPGVGVPFRTPFAIQASPATVVGAGATYAAVVAGHTLKIARPEDTAAPLTVTFDGTEATQAAFLAKINAQIGQWITAANAGGQVRLTTTQRGSIITGTVIDLASDADVLASLGLVAGAFGTPAAASKVPYTGPAGQLWLGVLRVPLGGQQYQHATVIRNGHHAALLLVDRGAAGDTASDVTTFAPSPTATP